MLGVPGNVLGPLRDHVTKVRGEEGSEEREGIEENLLSS